MNTHARERTLECENIGPVACRDCDLFAVCRVLDAARSRLPTGALTIVPAGTALYRTGAPAGYIYAIRKGMLKATGTGPTGAQRVLRVGIPGVVFGLEAFGTERYSSDVIALTPTICCAVPLAAFAEPHRSLTPELSSALVDLLSRMSAPRADLSHGSVRQRLSSLLLDLAKRLAARGFDAHRFTLAMSRRELASLLGAHVEAVCRTVRIMRQEGRLRLQAGRVGLLSVAAAEALSSNHR